MFILQPSGAFLDDVESYPFPMFGTPPQWRREYYQYLYRSIMEQAKPLGVRMWDFSRALNAPAANGEPVFLEWQHPTGKGNQYVANRIAAILRERIPLMR